MAVFSFYVKAFLKCHLYLEILADFPHKGNPQSLASSLSQMEKGGLATFPQFTCIICIMIALHFALLTDIFLVPRPMSYTKMCVK